MEATYMSINKWMDKEDEVHRHSGILLSHKEEECFQFSSSEVDEPRASYRQWSKSEREKQVSYINAYIIYGI